MVSGWLNLSSRSTGITVMARISGEDLVRLKDRLPDFHLESTQRAMSDV